MIAGSAAACNRVMHAFELAGNMPDGGAFAFAICALKFKFPAQDGGRSSMVEPQIVVLVVAGSSPVGHPFFKFQNPNPKL